MTNWIRIATLDDCPPGTACERVVGEQIVALFNVDGQLYALDGICPHQGGSLGKGRLDGAIVTCPWHDWQFDVRTGQHQLTAHLCHHRYRVKLEEQEILVALDEPR